MNLKLRTVKNGLLAAAVATLASMTFSLIPASVVSAAGPTNVVISSVPLNVVVPTQPQVMIALTNSNSMDSSDNIIDSANFPLSTPAATTSGRATTSSIMTWSGLVGAGSLSQSTSPANYTLPGAYTAPITGATVGSTPYTAPINTFTRTTTFPGAWGCAKSEDQTVNPAWTAIPNPTSDPPVNFNTPNPAPVPWDDTLVWWFNDDGGASNGYYQQAFAPPEGAAIHKVPSARQLFHGEAAEFAMNANGGLLSVGMGDGGGKPIPKVGGGSPPCVGPLCPGPGPAPDVWVCTLYKWTPTHTNSVAVTPYGDNSASRMNIAKQSIYQVIQAYGSQVDFGLMTYKNTGVAGYYSFGYYMSPSPGGFTSGNFSNVYSPPSAGVEWVVNPCWSAGGGVLTDCNTLAALTGLPAGNGPGKLGSFRFMQVANSGDDPSINDVLINGGTGHYVFMTNGTLTAPTLAPPAESNPITTPYSPVGPFTLSNYNQGQPPSCSTAGSNCVTVQYAATTPSFGPTGAYNLTPTNSGFVPYSPQVMFALRGWLWAGTPNPATANVRVPVNAAAGPDPASQAAYLAQFAPFLTPENNVPADDNVIMPLIVPAATYSQYYNQAIFSSSVQSPTAGLLSTALNPATWPAILPAPPCAPPKYVILITDGLPTEDLSGKSWPPPGSASATGYGATVAFNVDGTVNPVGTNNQAVLDTITQISALNSAGIKTFVVGMGAGVNPAMNPSAAGVLTAMAIAGGTKNYYPGTSPAAVVAQLNSILTLIAATNVATVSGAVNATALNGKSVVYQASYTGFASPDQDWVGNLEAFPVLANGNVSTTATWSSQAQLDAQSPASRLIATCGVTPGGGCAPGSGVPFRWASLSGAEQSALQPLDALGADRLNYLRGDTSNYAPVGDNFRPRSHILGDIVDSASLYIAASNGPYTGMSGYNSFVTTTKARTAMIYVGANDGMLHAFNASTGAEAFAFIPNGVFANLANLSTATYNNNHQFFVDGSPTAGDVKFSGGTWHTVLAGGLNDGGNSIYALDVTNPSAITSESGVCIPGAYPTSANCAVLWEFTDPHMGLSYSQPAFALTNDIASTHANPNGFLLFFGSGYNNSDGNPYLYALNPETGRIVSKDVAAPGKPLGGINLCKAVAPNPCNAALPNGLSGVTVINDTGSIGAPNTTVYAGDLQGNVWRVDISAADPKNWVVTLLFQARDSSGNPQPITVTPVVSLNPALPSAIGTVVYFGTGQYLGAPDIINPNTQSFYGVLDNGSGTTVTRASLVQQVISATSEVIGGVNVTVRTVTNNAVNWSSQPGWFMDLPIAGERVVTNPRLFNGEVVFTTYVPSAAALCAGGGQAFLMVLNFQNGGSFPQPQLDLNGDGMLNGSDQVGGLNPVGLSLGNVFASAPTILSASLGAIQAVKLVTISTPNIQSQGNFISMGEAGGLPQKITWTQLH